MENKVLSKVFIWMCAGLLITFLTGYYVSLHPNTVMKIFGGWGYLLLVLLELGLVIFLSARITKMNPTTAKVSYLLYSIVSGITFSSIFVIYNLSSIIYVFFITALVFAVFAAIGYFTKLDLSKISTYLFVGLIGVIICSIVNIFLHNSVFDLIISIITIIVFLGFTAYDIQKIKRLGTLDVIPEENLPIYGALELYLDFINLFIELLRIFGDRN